MQQDPAYVKLVQKSHILSKYHKTHRKAEIPQVQKEPRIVHKVIATGILSTIIHLVAYPLDTIKVRKMARSKVHDVARFQLNKVFTLTPYLGFFKGYLSLMIGNLCFLTLGQYNFFLGVLSEGLLKTFVDMSKISSQMGNKQMNMDLVKRVLPSAATFSVLRDLVSRSSYMYIVSNLLIYNQEWIKQDFNRRYHIYFGSAILATIVSHPFDVVFTKLASQQVMKYTGFFDVLKTIVKEEGLKKMMSGIDYRLFYNLLGVIIMGNSYDSLLKITLEIV